MIKTVTFFESSRSVEVTDEHGVRLREYEGPIDQIGTKVAMDAPPGTEFLSVTRHALFHATSGDGLIEAARERQCREYDSDHDDQHVEEQLLHAAVVYVAPAHFAEYWPWTDAKAPSPVETRADRIDQLANSGALIAAEIDRLLRLERKENPLPQ